MPAKTQARPLIPVLSGEKQANLTYFLNGNELNKGPLPKVFRLCPTFWVEKKWIVHSQGIRPPCLPEHESIAMGNYGGFPIRWIKFEDEDEPFDYYLALTPFFPEEELQVS